MASRVDVFVEDRAHEEFIRAMLARLAGEEENEVDVHFVAARGGHGRVLSELKVYQHARRKDGIRPSLLVVAVDANCRGHVEARNEIAAAIDSSFFPDVATGTPDPHVERWYLAEPVSLSKALGARVRRDTRKCERGLYKKRLVDALREAGHPVTLGGTEFASEIVSAMDLYQAGRNEPSLKHFVDSLRGHLRRVGCVAP